MSHRRSPLFKSWHAVALGGGLVATGCTAGEKNAETPSRRSGQLRTLSTISTRLHESLSRVDRALKAQDGREDGAPSNWVSARQEQTRRIRQEFESLRRRLSGASYNVQEGFDPDPRRLVRKAYEAEVEVMAAEDMDGVLSQTQRDRIEEALDGLEEKVNFLQGRIWWEDLFVS